MMFFVIKQVATPAQRAQILVPIVAGDVVQMRSPELDRDDFVTTAAQFPARARGSVKYAVARSPSADPVR